MLAVGTALPFAAVTLAGIVTGLTGFGFALTSVPLLLLTMSPASTVVSVLLIGQLTSSVNAWGARGHVDLPLLRALVPAAAVGMIAGSFALRLLDATTLKLAAASLVVAFTLVLALRRRRARRPPAWRQTMVGGASGLLATSVGLSGPPVVLLVGSTMPDKDRSRATLAAYFAVTSPLGLLTLVLQGGAPAHAWGVALVLAPLALAGRAVGSGLHRRTPQGVFRFVTLAITFAAGLGGMASALASLLGRG